MINIIIIVLQLYICSQDTVPSRKPCRTKSVKFVGRHILHKWILDEAKSDTKWYSGIVLDVIKGICFCWNVAYCSLTTYIITIEYYD